VIVWVKNVDSVAAARPLNRGTRITGPDLVHVIRRGLPVRTSRDVADQIDAEWSRSGPDDDADERRTRPATDLGPWCDEGNKFQTAAVDDFGSELNLLCNGSGVGR
jgi:hypothetical protein